MKFINRISELEKVSSRSYPLLVIFGRRREGKTAIVKRLREVERRDKKEELFAYSQAIEAPVSVQIEQFMRDTSTLLPKVKVERWIEVFEMLSRVSRPCRLVFDDFPYLVKSDSSLPSQLQKFMDHQRPNDLEIVILGSSQTMMHSMFLESSSPLFDRAGLVMHLEPMSYGHFCEAKLLDPLEKESFLKFSLLGGIPKYWEFLESNMDILELANEVFFETGSRLEHEPDRLLKDENIYGDQARAFLELIGRGVEKPSEIAGRMGVKQTSLSKPLKQLLDTSLIKRELPFEESVRSTKRSLYKISDPSLCFWYGVYSPNRSVWHAFSKEGKENLISQHASRVFEAEFLKQFPGASRYWEKNIEIDCVRFKDATRKAVILSELKFKKLSDQEKQKVLRLKKEQFSNSQLSKKVSCEFEVIDLEDGLKILAN